MSSAGCLSVIPKSISLSPCSTGQASRTVVFKNEAARDVEVDIVVPSSATVSVCLLADDGLNQHISCSCRVTIQAGGVCKVSCMCAGSMRILWPCSCDHPHVTVHASELCPLVATGH
jgi:hypothetical protein